MSDILDIVRDTLHDECDVGCGGAGCIHDKVRKLLAEERDRLTAKLEQAKRERDEWQRKWTDAVAFRIDMSNERDSAIQRAERAEAERDEWREDYYTDPMRQRIEADTAEAIATQVEVDAELYRSSRDYQDAATTYARVIRAIRSGAWRAAKEKP